MKLTAENVENTFKACLAENEESDGIIIDGVAIRAKFNQTLLAEHKQAIADMLKQLPNEFQADGGGGWSFLNMCVDANGNQWTDFHRTMDMLVTLGVATDMVQFLMPREMWKMLPGGMPYIAINNPQD